MSVKPPSPSINTAERIRAATGVSADFGYAQSRPGHTSEKFFSPALRLQTAVRQTSTRMKFDMIVAPIGGDVDPSGKRAGVLCKQTANVATRRRTKIASSRLRHSPVAAEWQME
jgi:hypothetical protein